MLLVKEKNFINLDTYLDINHFLSLEDDFYRLFSDNQSQASSTWTSGSIGQDNAWTYLNSNRTLYYYSREKEPQNKTYTEEFAKFLQLKYNAFNPYKILHLYSGKFREFVPESIQKWVEQLPFDQVATVSLFYNERYVPLGYHRDFNYWPVEDGDDQTVPNECTDLIWFRFNTDRRFYLYDIDIDGNITNAVPVTGHSVYFNHYNWHGCTDPSEKTSLTIKVEGKFKRDFHDSI